MRRHTAYCVLLIAIACLGQSGCKALSETHGEHRLSFHKESDLIGDVTVNRWLDPSVKVPISPQARSLGDVLSQSTTANAEQLKNLASKIAKTGDTPASLALQSNLNDNCTVIVRGKQIWYFIDRFTDKKILNAIYNELTHQISLEPGDAIATIPFERTVFRQDRPTEEVAIFLGGVAAKQKQVLIRDNSGKGFSSIVDKDFRDLAFGEIWTATVISRPMGDTLHHLVLGGNDASTIPISGAKSGHFKSGDIVELTNLQALVKRF